MSYENHSSRWVVERARKMGLSYEETQALAKKLLGAHVTRSAYEMHHTEYKLTGDEPPNSIRGDR